MFTNVFKYAVVLTVTAWSISCLSSQDFTVPMVDARLGPCSVDFTVTDPIHKPVYGAVIHAEFNYGRWGLRKMSLVLYTNPTGRARVEGLPSKLRYPPLSFSITYKSAESTWDWTGVACHEQPTVILGAH